jgi:endonuclease/exonuclease/phosphatase (EEP) superfamily protein YafD
MMTRRTRDFLQDKVQMIACMTLIATLCGFFGEVFWMFDLMCHFRAQYLAIAALCAGALLLFRDYRWCLVATIPVLINGCLVVPWFFGKPGSSPRAAPHCRILLSNVFTENRNSAALLDLIRSENPDVVVLQEVDERWLRELLPLNATMPTSRAIPRDDNFGIGVWSRHRGYVEGLRLGETPLGSSTSSGAARSKVPSIRARLMFKGSMIEILAMHALPPVSGEMIRQRNQQFADAALLAQQPGNFVLVGDLNVTMWSPFYAKLVRESGLVDARKGFGVIATWPTFFPGCKIPLDHCLVSQRMNVSSVRTGSTIGSDHLPLIVDVAPE